MYLDAGFEQVRESEPLPRRAKGAVMRRKLKASIGFGFARENWERAVDFVVEAEKLGVDSVWSAEAWGSDAVTPLAFLAARTSKIKLGTGIIQAGTRTPALVGMTAMTLAVADGRALPARPRDERPAGDRGLARRSRSSGRCSACARSSRSCGS